MLNCRVLGAALCAAGAVAYTHAPRRHSAALRAGSRRTALRATPDAACDPWSPTSSEEERIFEVCYLDESAEHIVECVCESEAELQEKGLLPPKRGLDASDLLFAVPNSGADGETLFSLADYETCLADDTCDVSDEVMDKAYGPDILEKIKEMRGTSEKETGPPGEKAARFHVHFGAGRLGLGLVVPAIAASGVPFAVVQRPKPRWEKVFASGGDEIDVSVNGEIKMKGAEVLSAEAPGLPETVPATSLVFGSSSDDLASLLSRATSFSCSLGAAMRRVMASTLIALPEVVSESDVAVGTREEQLRSRKLRKRKAFDPSYESAEERAYSGDLSPRKDPRPVLYCAENDHESVARLKRELRTRVRVVDCMVDRVCTGRRIDEDGIEIDAEPWPGSIVVLEPGFDPRYVPFSPSVATLPESLKHADYLSERKFSLVNGMHTVVAFLTLDYSYDGAPFVKTSEGTREYVLIKYSKMRRAEQRKVEAWRTARIARLIEQFGIEAIMRWEGVDSQEEVWNSLLAFADEVLVDRFSALDDLVSRVLGGGVANRYETRLKPTVKWLEARSPDSLSAFFLHAAKWDRANAKKTETTSLEDELTTSEEAETFVRDACSDLLVKGKRFCNKELEITHKQLIREQRQFGGKKFAPLVVDAIAEDKARAVAILQERRATREGRENDMRVLYEASTMV